MAGKGSRTQDQFREPKPLIPIHGVPLIAWAISGLPLDKATEIIFITNPIVASKVNLPEVIRDYIPRSLQISMQVVEHETSGQAETVLHGTSRLNPHDSILIFNCDTLISNNFPPNFLEFDGLLGVFPSSNPQMSYVESQKSKVIRTAEKRVISDCASTGLYFFKNLKDFRDAFLATQHENESYVAPLYNFSVAQGLNIGSFSTKKVVPLGTSEEIMDFINLNVLVDLPRHWTTT
jgi:NDP-sugar pyrophosphorylase family protein